MDSIVEQAYAGVRGAYAFSLGFQEYSAQKFPYAPVIVLVAHVINGALSVYGANKGKPTPYWLHSLVTTVLCGFGGGIITPVIVGARPSVIFANDLVLPVTFVIWYLVNYCGFHRVFNFKPVKLVWNILVTLWRTTATVNTVTMACSVLKPGPYYPTPLMGPLIGGTLINSLGAFVPFDKGLAPIQKGTPWPIQSAFLTSCMFYFIVKDREGFIGIAVRSLVGDLSQRVVVGLMAGIQVLTLVSQVVFEDPSANFLTPLHEFVYFMLGLQGPVEAAPVVPLLQDAPAPAVTTTTTTTTTTTAAIKPTPASFTFVHFLWFMRAAVIAGIGLYLLGQRIPPVSIPAVRASLYSLNDVPMVTLDALQLSGLSGDAAIGICQWAQLLPFATPPPCRAYALRLEQHSMCVNDTCTSPLACQAHGCRVACEASNGALLALRTHKVTSTGYRLALHPGAGAHAILPTQVFSGKNKDADQSLPWRAELPLTFTSANDLAAVDAHYKFANVELYVTRESEVMLVYNPQFAGTIFNVHKLSARLLWSGTNSVTCGNKAPLAVQDTDMSKPVEAEALYLDPESGLPRIRCTDGQSVALDIGSVYSGLENNTGAMSAMVSEEATGKVVGNMAEIASAGKSEL